MDRSQHLAPASVELVYRHLSLALSDAEWDRLIGRSPCEGIKLPKKERRVVVPPTAEQVMAVADAITPRYRAAVMLGAGAGLRLGRYSA